MEEQLISFEVAKLAKEKEFPQLNYPCYADDEKIHTSMYSLISYSDFNKYYKSPPSNEHSCYSILAPLWQQVMIWLLKRNIRIFTVTPKNDKHGIIVEFILYNINGECSTFTNTDVNKYYELLEQVILKAIELIEKDIKKDENILEN